MARRLFTLEQANATLPLVRRITEDIVTGYERWKDKVQAFEVAAALSEADRPDPRAELLQQEVQALAADLDRFLAELDALGIEFKGFDQGLVDFPSELGGTPIYLCWRLGEPSVLYWHERDAGYEGRRPIATRAA